VRASDGRFLEAWVGAGEGTGLLVALGQVFVTGATTPGKLYRIDPSQPAGSVTTVSTALGGSPFEMTFDGSRIWTANQAGSVSIVTPGQTVPWTVTTVTAGFGAPGGALYDGSNVWIVDSNKTDLFKLDGNGAIILTVPTGVGAGLSAFDGSNIWVPIALPPFSVLVVRASNGAVLATLTGNGLADPQQAAFDGQRIMVTNAGNSVSVFNATSLTALGSFSTGASNTPFSVCSDGINFWVTFASSNQLARF
jgi:hypothetical protein